MTPLTLQYRPSTWTDFVGQDVVAQTLRNAVATKQVHPVVILAGPRGTGKTTAARIFAAALNCEKQTGDPCRECASCKEFAAQRSTALLEIDGASNGRVEDARQIREELRYADLNRCLVYIVDEAHAMSTQAWQAFLKVLEEPPRQAVFVFCTTEGDKVPDTIKSRAFDFALSRISPEVVQRRLEHIVEVEDIRVQVGVLDAIAQHVNGGMRDAIVLLEQLRAYVCGELIQEHHFYEITGTVATRDLVSIYGAIVRNDAVSLHGHLKHVYATTHDLSTLVAGLAKLYNELLLAKLGAIPPLKFQVDGEVPVDYLAEGQTYLLQLFEQVKRVRIPARFLVESGLLKLFPKGLPQSAVTAPVPMAVPVPQSAPQAPNGPMIRECLTADQVVAFLGGTLMPS